jgi:hypothetical protein
MNTDKTGKKHRFPNEFTTKALVHRRIQTICA